MSSRSIAKTRTIRDTGLAAPIPPLPARAF